MNYSEAKSYIKNTAAFGNVYGLASIRELLKRFNNPQDDLKFVHIAGTNGKGSVLAYIAYALQAAGYKVGRYNSPPLASYREVIKVNDVKIDKQSVADFTTKIKYQIDNMLEEGLPHPTQFEIEGCLAFLYFQSMDCDIVLLETGLGGLEDATNIVQTSIIEIISSIGMDHMGVLGDTIEEIAYQKAGIIKNNTSVITTQQLPSVEKIIQDSCDKMNSKLVVARPDRLSDVTYGLDEQIFSYECENGSLLRDVKIHMAGVHQLNNAIIAIEALLALNDKGFTISNQDIYTGLSNASWGGRFSVLMKAPMLILDGAHNEDASLRLKESLEHYFAGKRIIFLLGILKDKEFEKIVENTAFLASEIITINMPENERLLPAEELMNVVRKYNEHVQASLNVQDAVDKAFQIANEDDVIVAFGSLSFLNAVEIAASNKAQK